ncbi:hypothetical protein ACLFMI_14380 [Pseudonocardia nantongensis]|uniref:hypothetical protein n=1 Tax=Pseudonocardia nantongensis TaxID=1181885 RepID=UPI00397AEF0E
MVATRTTGPYPLEGPWPEPEIDTDWHAVYWIYDARRHPRPTLLYIGAARFPADRLAQHRRNQAPFLPYARYWTYQWYTTRAAALAAEKHLNEQLDPPFDFSRRTGPAAHPSDRSRELRRPREGSRLQLVDQPYETGGSDVRPSATAPYRAARPTLYLSPEEHRGIRRRHVDTGIDTNQLVRSLLRLYQHDPDVAATVDELAQTWANETE